jgi:transposase
MNITKTVVGVDTAKRVFQLHWVDTETGEIVSKQIKRAGFLEHFANRTPCLIGMEACGGAQHWARRLIEIATDCVACCRNTAK